jgi:hypothetical protein
MACHMTTLSELERESGRILAQLRRLETLPVPSVAKMLGKNPEWVKSNLPVVILSAKSHRVRVSEVEAFLAKRTIKPQQLTNQ